MRTHGYAWLVTAFDSLEQDPREQLVTDYGGLTLHIKPGHGNAVSLVSVFLEDMTKVSETQLSINRFLSAMAWKDGNPFVTLGALMGGARREDRDKPRFNLNEGRVLRDSVISPFDFEHLQRPTDERQLLALALYREGLNSTINFFYRFLSFSKILNVRFPTGKGQKDWINANLGKIWRHEANLRLAELQKTGADIGEYLWNEGRNAIAHAYSEPALDPDMPDDRLQFRRDAELMRGIAEAFIQEELGIPSRGKIWKEHLYELKGFKELFGNALTVRLKTKDAVSASEFPEIPPLTMGLKHYPVFQCLAALPFRVVECKDGVVILTTDPTAQPMFVRLKLDFPNENLELIGNMLSVNRRQSKYTNEIGACFYNFLIEYYSNGYLEILNAATGARLSHKTAFIPVNIDLRGTIEGWQQKIVEILGE